MVKHTQVFCRLFPTYCLSVFDHFVGLALKGLILYQQNGSLMGNDWKIRLGVLAYLLQHGK